MASRSRYHYTRYGVGTRAVFTLCWAVLLALCLAIAVAPVSNDSALVHGVGITAAVASCFFLGRATRWSTVDVYADAVVIRGMWRSTRVALDEVDRCFLTSGVNDVGHRAKALAVRTRAGATRFFDDLWSADDDGGTSVAKVADELNRWVAARLGAPSPPDAYPRFRSPFTRRH